MKPFILLAGLLLALTACDPLPELATLAPMPTATVMPFPTTVPTVRPLPPPTITPTPRPVLIQLTTDGCCVNPAWSADSKRVLFIDKPAAEAETGYYALAADGRNLVPEYVDRVGLYSPDWTLAAFAEGAQTVVELLSTGESWIMPNNGQAVEFSPDNAHVAWEQEAISGPYDQRQNDLYVANVDGTDAQRVARVYGGGLIGWLPNYQLLFMGRPGLDTRERTLTMLDVRANIATDLVTAERIGSVAASKDGAWVAYFISFNEDEERNGLWVQRTDGSAARRLDLWGAYQWRDASHLVVIPMREAADRGFDVLEVDAATGQTRPLIDPAVTPLHILNGDWRISPDGQQIVFVSSLDRNLWVLKLPK